MPLLERESELADLDAALAMARAGQGRVALVSGSAGMGKTSVVSGVPGRDRLARPRPGGRLRRPADATPVGDRD